MTYLKYGAKLALLTLYLIWRWTTNFLNVIRKSKSISKSKSIEWFSFQINWCQFFYWMKYNNLFLSLIRSIDLPYWTELNGRNTQILEREKTIIITKTKYQKCQTQSIFRYLIRCFIKEREKNRISEQQWTTIQH